MGTTDCELLSRPADVLTDCISSGVIVSADCIHCNDRRKSPWELCELTWEPISQTSKALCSAFTEGGLPWPTMPGILIIPATPQDYDILLRATAFHGQSRPQDLTDGLSQCTTVRRWNVRGHSRYYLKPVALLLDPCHPIVSPETDNDRNLYCCWTHHRNAPCRFFVPPSDGNGQGTNCSDDGTGTAWLCRWYTSFGADIGWRMHCTRVLGNVGDNFNAVDQKRARTLFLTPDVLNGRMMYVDLHLCDPLSASAFHCQHGCFSLANQWCFGQCPSSTDNPQRKWDCDLHSTGGFARRDAWSRLLLDFQVGHSTHPNYPARNPADLRLWNDVLATFAALNSPWQVELALPATSDSGYERQDIGVWFNGYDFRNNVPGGIPPGSTTPDDPPVRYGGTGDVVPITIRSVLSGRTFDAQLTLMRFNLTLRLYLDPGPFTDTESSVDDGRKTFRVGAVLDLNIVCRVKRLSPVGDYPYTLWAPDDPFDVRVRDPSDPQAEHRHERLYAIDADYARVPHRVPGEEDGGVVSWRGMVGPAPYAGGFFEFHDPTVGRDDWLGRPTKTCCVAMLAAHGLVVPGEANDWNSVEWQGGDAPDFSASVQRYAGNVAVLVYRLAASADGGLGLSCPLS